MTTTVQVKTQSFTDVSEWLLYLQEQYKLWLDVGWDFLDTLRNGIGQFGRTNDKAVFELYDLASQATGMSIKRLQNLVSMSRSEVSKIAQEYELDFGYAEAVLGLEPDQADDILSQAKAKAMSVSQVRKEAWTRKQAIPDGGNSYTAPVRDDDYEQQAEAYAEDGNGYDWTPELPPPADLARQIKAQYSAGDIATLVAELVSIPY